MIVISPIFWEKEDTILKLINILPRKKRVYLKLDMEKTESRGENFVHAAHKNFRHIFHKQLFLYAIMSSFRVQVDTYETF